MPALCIWRQSYLHRLGQVQTALTCCWGLAGLAEHEIGFAAFNQPTTVLLHIHVFIAHAAALGDVFAVFVFNQGNVTVADARGVGRTLKANGLLAV